MLPGVHLLLLSPQLPPRRCVSVIFTVLVQIKKVLYEKPKELGT